MAAAPSRANSSVHTAMHEVGVEPLFHLLLLLVQIVVPNVVEALHQVLTQLGRVVGCDAAELVGVARLEARFQHAVGARHADPVVRPERLVGKVAHQLLLARLLDPSLALGERRALRPARTVGAEGHNVDRLAAVDGEDENVRVLGQQHLRRVGVELALFLAQRSHEPLARDQPTVGPAATPHQRVGAGDGRGSGGWHDPAHLERGCGCSSQPITRSASWVEPSSKVMRTLPSADSGLLDVLEPLAKAAQLGGHALDKRVEQLRTVDARHAVLLADGLGQQTLLLALAHAPLEEEVARRKVGKLQKALVEPQTLQRILRIRSNRNPRTDLGELGCALEDVHGHAAIVQANGKRQAANPTAHHGHIEVLAPTIGRGRSGC
ncbi:hypothetical protein L1887_48913 [Cichorium endivia]|nr:hypothetical protein L1887_48913 [Cichorium endivia]